MKLLSAVLALACLTSIAAADTVEQGGAQLTLPDEGWVVREEDRLMTLGLEQGGAFIEVYDFSKAPAADKAVVGKLVAGRKETTEVAITEVTAHEQHGLKGIAFRGTAKIRGHEVELACVALDGVGKRAVLAIAFTLTTLDQAHRREVADVLASVRRK